MQLSNAAARSPAEGVAGDQETADTMPVPSTESWKTWRKIGPMRVSEWESGLGK